MRPTLILGAALTLAACEAEPRRTAGGCTLFSPLSGPILQAYNQACIAREREEQARAQGGVVTRCTPVGGAVSCVTY